MTSSPDQHGASGAPSERNLAIAEVAELARARNEVINIVQWLARIACSYVTNSVPERCTDLDFRAEDTAFVTKQFAEGVGLEMRLPDLHLQFLQNGKPVPHIFDPQERSPAEAEAWILVELLHRGIDRGRFTKKLPYAVPGLLTGDAEDYAPQACGEGLAQLTTLFVDAAAVLKEAARTCGADKPRVVCLPQTLDLVVAPSPGTTPIVLGFSPGDKQNPQPHFYHATVAKPAPAERAVISAGELLAQGDPARAAAILLKIAVD